MSNWRHARKWSDVKWIGATIIALLVAAVLFVLSGVYSVAASRGHFALTSFILEFAMRRSVSTHSFLITSPPLDDSTLVQLGAGHFHGACAPCHGAPGQHTNPVVDRMLPPPPPLSHEVTTWSNKQLFWIVQNGIKYTGMPAWVAPEREDEIWAIVAFLRAMPGMSPQRYRTLARAGPERERSARELARFGTGGRAISMCGRCHGTDTLAPASSLVPVIAGQSPEYLERALRNYMSGERRSGIMQPVAAELDEDAIGELAQYYSGLQPVQADVVGQASEEQLRRGQDIATLGIASKGVPACLNCHAGSAPSFPKLIGQHAAYVVSQLELWRRGQRSGTVHGAIMAPIALRLSAEHAADVAAFFESVGRGETAANAGRHPEEGSP